MLPQRPHVPPGHPRPPEMERARRRVRRQAPLITLTPPPASGGNPSNGDCKMDGIRPALREAIANHVIANVLQVDPQILWNAATTHGLGDDTQVSRVEAAIGRPAGSIAAAIRSMHAIAMAWHSSR